MTRDVLCKLFGRKLRKIMPGFNMRAKDMRMSSITHEFVESGLVRASSLGHHKTTKMTTNHYIRGVKNL
jgi:hypothetical protein